MYKGFSFGKGLDKNSQINKRSRMTVALLIQKESVEFVVFIFIKATIAIGFNKNDILCFIYPLMTNLKIVVKLVNLMEKHLENDCKIKLHLTNLQSVLCGLNNLILQCANTIFICS